MSMTSRAWSWQVRPCKSTLPVTNSDNTQPDAQTSTAVEYLVEPNISSGAR